MSTSMLPSSTTHDVSSLRFHVNPGATLSVETPGPETTVSVTVGELHDAIEASWEVTTDSKSTSAIPSTSSSPLPLPPVEAKQIDDRVSLVAHAGSGVRTLVFRIPSRYCSVHAATNGGDLSVEAVREAALEVSTSPGGSVSLGAVRATVARIVTGGGSGGGGEAKGGSVSARELVADSLFVSTEGSGNASSSSPPSSFSSSPHAASDGGSASIERLVARRGSVKTGGGSLTVRSAFYGQSLELDSGGGGLRLGGLTPRASDDENASSCSSSSLPPLAFIRSRGGSLSIEALEGDADVDSGGGELSLHLLRGSKGLTVRARSGGASVRAAVAPELLNSSSLIAGDGVVLLNSSSSPSSSSTSSTGRTKDVSSAAAEADASLDSRWEKRKGRGGSEGGKPFPPPPLPASSFAPLTPATASTAGRGGGGDSSRDHGPDPATLVLIDARPGGEVRVEEESWMDAVARKARAAMEARKSGKVIF